MQAHQRKKMSRLRILHLKPRHQATTRTKSNGGPTVAADPAKIVNP